MSAMRISQSDVLDFATWSGDRNPIHVDSAAAKQSAFGGTIVHGALSTIEALNQAHTGDTARRAITALEIEFRGAIRPDHEYQVQSVAEAVTDRGDHGKSQPGPEPLQGIRADVWDGQKLQLSVSAEFGDFGLDAAEASDDWVSRACAQGNVTTTDEQPVRWSPTTFRSGERVLGIHRFGTHAVSSGALLSATQEKVLGLASFIVGMKAPGLSSLFTRLSVRFHSTEETQHELAYRLTFKNYDAGFRLLEAELEIATPQGRPIATAVLQSYVRFPPMELEPAAYQRRLGPALASWEGKVALVCGASRGLGAEFAAALGAAKCRVYLACRNPNDAVNTLVKRIQAEGGSAEIVSGDVGDSQWCEATRQRILGAEGRIDILILNACAPPVHGSLIGGNSKRSAAYIHDNFALAQTPLIHFLPAVAEAAGTVIAISSAFVDEAPSGFSDYIAVKMAVEGAVKTAAHEQPSARFLIARPPKLQTSWNDTPTGAMGAIPASTAATQILKAAAQWDGSTNLIRVDSFPDEEISEPIGHAIADWQLVLCASFTLDPMTQSMRLWSSELGLRIDAELAPYAQILQQTLDPTSRLSQNPGGAVLLVRVSDWLREQTSEQPIDPHVVTKWLKTTAEEHIEALRAHRTFAAGPTLLMICPSTSTAHLSESLFGEIESLLISRLGDVPGLTVVNVREYHSTYEVPVDGFYDPLREEIAHIPFQDAYYHFLTALIVRYFHHRIAGVKKVIVLDCDNTLWRGVVGELGHAGIELDEAHHFLHRRLTQLAESGMLVCLCSKNEEPDVWSVFENRTDFGLQRNQIVASAVNWLPKSQNLRMLAENLNLGLDSFIFLDDNPVECAEVRDGCPGVTTLQWPQDPREAIRLLNHLWEFDVVSTTTEDRKRTQMYREEFERQQVRRQASSFQGFIDSLKLEVDVRPLTQDDLSRASQLTMRTNQFNFTTIRRTEAELSVLMGDSQFECRTVRVRDRFGDYGLVGLFIVNTTEDRVEVDTFLLSCRVLGRGVEHRMAAAIGQIAEAVGGRVVRWRHIATERNTPARMFLAQIAGDTLPAATAGESLYDADAAELAAFEFQATAAEPQGDTVANSAAQPVQRDTARSPRQRERQIARIVQELSTYDQLAAAFGGDVREATPGTEAPTANDLSDVTQIVVATFAKALRLSEDEITRIDRLESLGCDSLRIVEITVALIKHFPSLPKTLLFEHRSVSEIIQGIVQISDKNAGAATKASTKASPSAAVTAGVSDIAIIGIGVRCAGADSPQTLWDLLARGESAVVPVPQVRQSFIGELNDERDHFAGLIEGAADFDPEFFGISPREAEYMDPQLRLLLQTAWHGLEDAGSSGERFDPATGIFVGVMYADYGRFANPLATQSGSVYRCWEGFSLANRLSQVLGCYGPSLSIDTACSSSATAFHYACRSLQSGDCTTAVVSGVNLIIDPDRLTQLGKLGILSPSGRCVPFGDQADGTVLGEGVVSLVLRPLDEAQQRGDRIYAVVKGTGLSSGAGSVGFTAPNPNAQARAAGRALAAAGVDPRTVTYIETHGTGTELGDPIEVRGLQMAYCAPDRRQAALQIDHRCMIGSIKPNAGHLEAGAGLMGILKAALQLHHQTLVPSLTSESPNSQIPFADLPFAVQRTLVRWTRTPAMLDGAQIEIPLRAGVNSFGVGGSNAHVVLEEPPAATEPVSHSSERPAHMLALSAISESALRKQASAWEDYLTKCGDDSLANACFSANVGRKHHRYRAAVVVDRDQCGRAELAQIASGSAEAGTGHRLDSEGAAPMRTALLFSGQGAQYPSMLRQLHQDSPVFRHAFDSCAEFLADLLPRPLYEVVFCGDIGDRDAAIHQTGFTQPALFSIQYALFELWKSWGLVGDVLMGHSIGEVAAYCAAGGCSLHDALRLVAARGRLMQALPSGGSMCSIALDVQSVRDAIQGEGERVSIAAINGPHQTVISGVAEAVERVSKSLEAQGAKVTNLSVSHAFHSALMDPMLAEFESVLRGLDLDTPRTPIVSSATGVRIDAEMASPEYWVQQARQAVRFSEAMSTLDDFGVTHYVELGPHPVLLAMGRNCLPESQARWLPSVQRGRDDWSIILASLGSLYVDGADINWSGFDQPYERRRIQVPGYQFDTRRIWIEGLGSAVAASAVPAGRSLDSQLADPSERLLYRLNWQEVSRPRSQRNGVSETWVVLSDNRATVEPFAESLQTRGIEVITCTTTRDLERMFRDHAHFQRVVWLDGGPGVTAEDVSDDRSIDKIFVVSQIVAAARASQWTAPRGVWLITENAVATGSRTPLALPSAPLWGWARVAALECGDWWGGIIDVDDWRQQTDRLVEEILAPTDEDQVALRETRRLVPRLQRGGLRTLGDKAENRLAAELQHGAVLITGGLGGLGIRVADWLGGQGVQKLILCSRSGIADSAGLSAIDALRRQGIDVSVIAADVSTRQGVEACVEARGDLPLVGVFHLAGIDRQCPVGDASLEQVHQVMDAKVKGAWLLHTLCQTPDLKLFVCFSSIAAIWGSAGRGLYAAANAYLDTLTHHRRSLGLPALCVNFGPWQGGGMAGDEALTSLEKMGNRGLDPDQALRLVGNLLEEHEAQAIIADIDWSRFRPILEARRAKPLLADLGREVSGDVEQAPGRPVGTDSAPWLADVRGVPEGERYARMLELLQVEFGRLLRIPDPTTVAKDRNLYEMGMDSLTSAEFATKLRTQTGIKESNLLLLKDPTLDRIAGELLSRLENHLQAELPPPTNTNIIGYREEIESQIFAFCRQAWPKRREDWLEPRWKWMFVESAKRLGVEPKLWLYQDEGHIAGHHGAQFIRFKVGDTERITAWLVDTRVLESHRQAGVGARLVMQSQADMPFNLSLGQTEEMRNILEKLGWRRVAPLQTYLLMIKPSRVLSDKLPTAAIPAAAAWFHLRSTARRLTQAPPASQTTAREIHRFGAPHDELWRRIAKDYGCATVRDASYLNWKYVDQPGQSFTRLEISRGDEVTACVILSVAEPDQSYGYRRMSIVDLVTGTQADELHDVIRHVVMRGKALAADAVIMHVINPQIEQALEGYGFLRRTPTRHLVVCADESVDEQSLLDPRQWLVTQGDSDIDRPW